jgi:hypothetical protein
MSNRFFAAAFGLLGGALVMSAVLVGWKRVVKWM